MKKVTHYHHYMIEYEWGTFKQYWNIFSGVQYKSLSQATKALEKWRVKRPANKFRLIRIAHEEEILDV